MVAAVAASIVALSASAFTITASAVASPAIAVAASAVIPMATAVFIYRMNGVRRINARYEPTGEGVPFVVFPTVVTATAVAAAAIAPRIGGEEIIDSICKPAKKRAAAVVAAAVVAAAVVPISTVSATEISVIIHNYASEVKFGILPTFHFMLRRCVAFTRGTQAVFQKNFALFATFLKIFFVIILTFSICSCIITDKKRGGNL